MLEEVCFNWRGKKFCIEARRVGVFGKFRGLMFRRRECAEALLFDFEKSSRLAIHSFFVFFPFIAIWLNGENKVVEIKKVSPFAFSVIPRRRFQKLVEIPLNSKYKKFVSSSMMQKV